MFHRNHEAAERARQRQQTEDDAPRLSTEVPNLKSLKLTYSYKRGEARIGESTHSRLVVVERAPALFVVPCSDRDCKDGGHDITSRVMQALKSGRATFEGDDPCHGALGSAGVRCSSVLSYGGEAVYR